MVYFSNLRPFGRDAPRRLAVDCAFGKGRNAVRASGVLRFALRRGAMGQRKARPLWVDVARAPVDVAVAGLQTGFGLVSRMARSVTGSQTLPPVQKRTLLKSMKSFRSTQESSTDDVLGLSLGTGVDLPVVTFRDDDDPADVLRAQRKARNRAPFVVLRMPSVLEEGDIEAGDDLSTRMRKKAAARLRKKGTRSLSPFPSQREKEAIVAVKLAAFATRREVSDERTSLTRAATSPTWGSEALRRDLESRTWRVYARVGEVRGARCSVPIVIKSQVVLEVGAKISFENTTTTSTKTTRKLDSLTKFTRPRVKDYATDGADFNGERLVVAACVPRSSAHLRVSVYERLKTDLVRTRRLGIATIPLDEVPVLSAPLTGVSRRSVGAFLSNLRARRTSRGAIWSGSSNRYCMRRHEL